MNYNIMYECPNCMYFVYHKGTCPNCGRNLIESPQPQIDEIFSPPIQI